MKKPIVYNYYGKYVSPFNMVNVKGNRTICRFCEQEFHKKRQNLERDKEYRRNLLEYARIPDGSQAVEMICFGGPAGTGYVCLPHAKGLQENLQKTLEKSHKIG